MLRKKKTSSSFNRMPGFKAKNQDKKPTQSNRKVRLWVFLIVILSIWSIWWAWFYVNIVQELPDIEEVENFAFKEATVITDRDWEVLYRLFEENRKYVEFENISPDFVNALIATEDQRFWENPWVDWKWTLRAGITDILEWKTQWWSTLTQQIIKNVLLTPEKKIERKLKEIILAVRLSSYIRSDLKEKHNTLSPAELDRKAKEEIIEIYSNLIFLWNNAYWVETASNTYFAKSASELSILEAAILAWMPQQPSRLNPYTNRAWLMGQLQVTDLDGTPAELTQDLKAMIYQRIEENLNDSSLTFRRDDRAVLDFFRWLLTFKVQYQWQTLQVNYTLWRKDIVLARMYEEWYITESELKTNFTAWFEFEFQRWNIEIKAPHFVFWIRNLLEEQYDPEFLRREGLTIKTSLDYGTQILAEEAITENNDHLISYSAGNAAMVYLDSKNGDILAYVWSKDFNNKTIDGEVDIVQSRRQPGSAIKPLLYALGFMNLPLTTKSPLYDIETTLAGDEPNNSDWEFLGLIPLSQALAWSRNIPTIKLFLALWGESIFKDFLQNLWVNSLTTNQNYYWYPMAIWAWEMTMLELAEAYTHLSASWKPWKINPILEIRSSDGSILYQKETESQEEVIPAWVSYLIRDILATKSNFPAWWVSTLSHPDIQFASKSGTTNVVRGDDKLPRDWWLVNYTNDKVIVNWAWNTNGNAMRRDAFWGWLNSPIRKAFVNKLVANDRIENSIPQQVDVRSVAVSKLTWKLASNDTPLLFTQQSLGYNQSIPTQVESWIETIEIDTLCNWLPSELTPTNQLKRAFVIEPTWPLPINDQEDILEWWQEEWIEGFLPEEEDVTILLEKPTQPCEEREIIREQGEITLSVAQPTDWQEITRTFTLRHQSRSPFSISEVRVMLWSIELVSLDYRNNTTVTDITPITIPQEIPWWSYRLKVISFDVNGYSTEKEIPIRIVQTDTEAPELLTNRTQVTPQDDGTYSVTVVFRDKASTIQEGNFTRWEQWEETLHTFSQEIVSFSVDSLDPINYTVSDTLWNEASGTIILEDQ